MRKNTKRGFTLVELLVVIAILAILATVSVVGYTAFIERASVSNDENVAAQLNKFLVAVKADSTGPFYNEEINEDNVWEVTDYILKESGLNELDPQSAKHGYHFYFDLEKGEYVVLSDKDAVDENSGLTQLVHFFMNAYAEESRTYNVRPGNCFTKENKYYLVDTTGDLADVIGAFYGFDELEGASTLAKFQTFLTKVNSLEIAPLSNLVKASVFVTDAGNLVQNVNDKHELIFVQDTAIAVSNTITDGTNTVVLGGDKYLLEVSNDLSITIPNGLMLPANSLYIKTNGKNVTVKIEAGSWNEIIDMVDANFVPSDVTVQLGGTKYEVFENEVCLYAESAEKGTHHTYLKYNNPMSSFDLVLNADGTTKKVYNSTTNLGYIALDKGSFTLSLDASTILGTKQAANATDTSVVSTRDVVWSVHSDSASVLEYKDGAFVFKTGVTPDTVKVIATAKVDKNGYAPGVAGYNANNRASQTFEIKVVRLTGATLTLAGKQWAENSTLIHDTDTETYTVAIEGDPTYNENKIDEIELNEKLTVSITNGTPITNSNATLTTASEGTCTLTVKVGDYVTYTTNVTVFDTSKFTVAPVYDSIKYLGNATDNLTVGDLFDGTIPAGAELKIFYGLPDSDYMKAPTALVETAGTFKVASNSMPLDTTNWKTQKIQFTGVSDQEVSFAIFHNGVRISKDLSNVNIVNGTNVSTYADLTAKLNTSKALTDSIVFLGDITMSGDINYFDIPSGKTLYGNTYTFNIKSGRETEAGIINLSGRIQDVKIVGKAYPDFASSVGDPYGSSAICIKGDAAYIYNCYISNTRSPIRAEASVTIEDSVLFGGRYSNIDIIGGTVTIKGTVTTVQQLYSVAADNNDGEAVSNVIGVGVIGWFGDVTKTVKLADANSNLVQYNFMNADQKQYLPKVTVADTIEVIDLKLPFNDIFTKDTYAAYRYTAANGTVYANAGAVSTDKYMLNYTVTGNPTSSSAVTEEGLYLNVGPFYQVGSIKTVTAVTPVNATDTFTINYNTAWRPKVGTVITAGSVQVTGAQLAAGVQFELVYNSDTAYWDYRVVYYASSGTGWHQTGVDKTPYQFQVTAGNNYKTVVLDSSISGIYNNLDFKYDTDLSASMSAADSLLAEMNKGSLAGRGIHYCKMLVDVYTPKSSAASVGTKTNDDGSTTSCTYQDRLEEYLTMGTYYTPEVFEFNSDGTMTNYWEKSN